MYPHFFFPFSYTENYHCVYFWIYFFICPWIATVNSEGQNKSILTHWTCWNCSTVDLCAVHRFWNNMWRGDNWAITFCLSLTCFQNCLLIHIYSALGQVLTGAPVNMVFFPAVPVESTEFQWLYWDQHWRMDLHCNPFLSRNQSVHLLTE